MKRTQFIASLTAVLAGLCQVAVPLTACDKCNQAPHQNCRICDDCGILDVASGMANEIHTGVKGLISLPSLQLTRKQCDTHPGKASSCGCELNTCGAELNTCGAELNTCGCELNSCGCELHAGTATPSSRASGESRQRSPAGGPSVPSYRNAPPAAPSRAPLPLPRAVDEVPGNPFIDDAAARVRRMPARTVSHGRSILSPAGQAVPSYGARYDEQANARQWVRLRDDSAVNHSALASNPAPELGVEAYSRGAGAVAPLRAVVVASAAKEVEPKAVATHPARIGPQANLRATPLNSTGETESEHFDYYHNPLR
ncbi:hypothetical protein [Aureliella helgolandensis]|uniref:Uncharacterized protein n=1 Tax=Aureliella helgolandensis TaxID=2527968 RepID=A0A518GGG9_9BACT|nr:hypothetical protein [Aureliella helgolandensis]QDV27680.1 hypothetical protein Q31a_60730 [Aureliella helgolandensis]